MMFIVRTGGARPDGVAVKMVRRTPVLVAKDTDTTDFFCVGDPDAMRERGWQVVAVHDGWYADDTGGGVVIFGQGKFWEVRDTPFTVKEAAGPATPSGSATNNENELVNVRGAIFGA